MIWLFIGAILVGVLTGMALRVPAALMLSGLLGLASFSYMAFSEYSILAAAVTAFGLLAAVQLGYFGGLLLSGVFPKKKAIIGLTNPSRNDTFLASWLGDSGDVCSQQTSLSR